MPKLVQRSCCLAGDLAAPPRFVAYRCDSPGLTGHAVHRTRYVANHPMFQLLSEKFTPDLAFDIFSHEQRVVRTGRIAPKMILEYVFDATRKRIDPRLPSRLSSIFLFFERECADLFQRRFAAQRRHVIYKCAVQGWWFQAEANTIYEATLPLVSENLSRSGFYEALERVSACAASYWSNEFDDPCWPELLVDGSVEFLAVEPGDQ